MTGSLTQHLHCARLTNINTSLIVLKSTVLARSDRGRTDQRGILARRTLRAHLAVWLQVHRLHRTFVKMAIADISELASHIYEPRILEQLKKKRKRRRRWPTSTTMTRRRWCRKYWQWRGSDHDQTVSTHCTHHLRGLCKYSAKCAKCTVVQTVLRLCKHPAGCAACTRLCKYSAEVACCKNLFQIVEIFCKTCRFYKVVQIFCRMCRLYKPCSGCANILQQWHKCNSHPRTTHDCRHF